MMKMLLMLFFISFLGISGEREIINYMKIHNPKLSDKEAQYIYKNVVFYSNEYDFDPVLIFSVMKTESHFKHSTVSSAGAKGLMQLMPFNFKEFGVDNSIQGNIKGGVMHLKRDYDKTRNVTKTLVCYNAGCGRLQNDNWLKIRETTGYITKINDVYPEIKKLYYSNSKNKKKYEIQEFEDFDTGENTQVVQKTKEELKREKFLKNKIRYERKELQE